MADIIDTFCFVDKRTVEKWTFFHMLFRKACFSMHLLFL